jgi:micrococcal nuclease
MRGQSVVEPPRTRSGLRSFARGSPTTPGKLRAAMKLAVGIVLVALLAGCSSDPVSVDHERPPTVTVTVSQGASAMPTHQPQPPNPPDVTLSGVSCGHGDSQALDPQGLPVGFRLWVVRRVIDGDTVEAMPCAGGRVIDVRLIGIDTPETVDPSEPVQCYGPEASAFTHRWLNRRLVRLDFDKDRIDPYGRTLAYVVTEDGHLFNQLLVRWGFATVATFPPNVKHVNAFKQAERRAQEQNLGLWGAC